jgi:hypothetical protein
MAAASLTLAGAEDARAIVEAARNRIDAATVSTRSRMVIEEKGGQTSERVLDQYSSDGPKGSRTLIVFKAPASVAGTRFLTMETGSVPTTDGYSCLHWVRYGAWRLPRVPGASWERPFLRRHFLGRSRRIARHSYLPSRGNPIRQACHVIESVSIDASYQYSKMVSWIDKASDVAWKIELYDRKGALAKVLEVLEVKDIQSRLTPVKTRMTTVAAKTSTTINAEIVRYDDKIPEGVFTQDYLSTGG